MSNHHNPEFTFLKSTVSVELAGTRLDQALAQLFPDYSRPQLQHWIRAGHVTVNSKTVLKTREKVSTNQMIEINAPSKPVVNWDPQAISLNILYEDEALLVIDKPAGLIVHPGAGHSEGTLVNALLHYDQSLNQVPRAGIIHRLDKDTTGLLVIARNLSSHHSLIKAMKSREIIREYDAIVKGVLIAGRTIEAPVGRHPLHRIKMAVTSSGRPAITHFRVIHRYRSHTHIRVRLETGRTHQIRVHMTHIRHPIVGDPLYGSHIGIPAHLSNSLKTTLKELKRQALHASLLRLNHPLTEQAMEWTSPLPSDIVQLIGQLKEDKKEAKE